MVIIENKDIISVGYKIKNDVWDKYLRKIPRQGGKYLNRIGNQIWDRVSRIILNHMHVQ